MSMNECCAAVLRKLVVFGFAELDKNHAANEFIKLVFQRLEQFLKSSEL